MTTVSCRRREGGGEEKEARRKHITTISLERRGQKKRKERERERERMLTWEDDTYQTTARFLLREGATTGATIPTEGFVVFAPLVRH